MLIKESVIIVAGGKGLRMGSELPKQFIKIKGLPILMHTLSRFHEYNPEIEIILVIPKAHNDYWNELIQTYNFNIPHKIAFGGETRFESVKNGLEKTTNHGLIAIHDGVRPFVSKAFLKRCFEGASKHKSIVPATLSKESIRQISGITNKALDRSLIRLIQTPQIFESSILRNAYNTQYKEVFTDDASVVEFSGIDIHLVEGEDTNIKITTPFDLQVGEIIIDNFIKK